MNSMEVHAAQARKAQSDARRAAAARSAEPASMLQTGSEAEAETVQQKYLEEAEHLEHGGNEEIKLQAAKTMQGLQYWLDHPEEHNAEVQTYHDRAQKTQAKKAAFVKAALEKGVVSFMGQKHQVMTKDPKGIEADYD